MIFICASIVVGALLVRKPLLDIRRDLNDMNQNVKELNQFFNHRSPSNSYADLLQPTTAES